MVDVVRLTSVVLQPKHASHPLSFSSDSGELHAMQADFTPTEVSAVPQDVVSALILTTTSSASKLPCSVALVSLELQAPTTSHCLQGWYVPAALGIQSNRAGEP